MSESKTLPRAVDAFRGLDCKGFDPEKSDHIHGRAGASPLFFDAMRGVKVRGCEACVFGERYGHTCEKLVANLAEALEASC